MFVLNTFRFKTKSLWWYLIPSILNNIGAHPLCSGHKLARATRLLITSLQINDYSAWSRFIWFICFWLFFPFWNSPHLLQRLQETLFLLWRSRNFPPAGGQIDNDGILFFGWTYPLKFSFDFAEYIPSHKIHPFFSICTVMMTSSRNTSGSLWLCHCTGCWHVHSVHQCAALPRHYSSCVWAVCVCEQCVML